MVFTCLMVRLLIIVPVNEHNGAYVLGPIYSSGEETAADLGGDSTTCYAVCNLNSAPSDIMADQSWDLRHISVS